MKCDEKLVRLEETYGDWVKQEKENCGMSSGEMTKELYPYQGSTVQVRTERRPRERCAPYHWFR